MTPIKSKACASVVTRIPVEGDQAYLRIAADGTAGWTDDPMDASAFDSMRDATRMAFRLPAELRAFGMPLKVERDAFATLH